MPTIHPTSLVSKKAELAENVTVGPFTIIEEDVIIGDGSQIHSNVLIANGARIGKNCQIHHGAVLSTLPQDLKFSGEKTTLEIGDETVIREYATMNRGTNHRQKTLIGSHCFLMAYTHVAHDCWLGDRVILANSVQMAGHVTIEDWVSIGGLTAIHQFSKIGQHAFIGGGLRVSQDVPPYVLAAGEPLAYKGLNVVGLTRRGFSKETVQELRRCYRYLFRSNLNRKQALDKINSEMKMIPEVETVVNFIKQSERGVIR